MTQSEVIRKLSRECCLAMGDFTYYKTVSQYIQMAVSVGLDHFDKKDIEIIAMYFDGVEAGRFKSTMEAERKLGIPRGNIWAVLEGRRVSAGGLKFMKSVDYELIPREEKSSSISKNEL